MIRSSEVIDIVQHSTTWSFLTTETLSMQLYPIHILFSNFEINILEYLVIRITLICFQRLRIQHQRQGHLRQQPSQPAAGQEAVAEEQPEPQRRQQLQQLAEPARCSQDWALPLAQG